MNSSNNYVFDSLGKLHYPDYVRIKANEIYTENQFGPGKWRNKKRLLFFCLLSAYIELGEIKDPKDVAQKLGLSRREMNRALVMFSEDQTGYKPPKERYHPSELIPIYISRMDFGRSVEEEVVALCNNFLESHKEFLDLPPQTVAMGFIDFYVRERGYRIDDLFFREVGVSKKRATEMSKRLGESL